MADSKLAQICAAYTRSAKTAANESYELEIRIKNITRELIESLVRALGAGREAAGFDAPTLQCSINSINSSARHQSKDGTRAPAAIRTQIFERGIKTADTYSTKTQTLEPVYFDTSLKWSAGIARETYKDALDIGSDPLLRFKTRVSWTRGPWRLDVTLIHQEQMSAIGSALKKTKDAMFPASMTADNFLQMVDARIITQYECELEWIGKTQPTPEDFMIVDTVSSLVGTSGAPDVLKQIAKYTTPGATNLRFRGVINQAKSITKSEYTTDYFPPVGYYAVDKADGLRAIVIVNDAKCSIVFSTNVIEFTRKDKVATTNSPTICDCEYITSDRIGKPCVPTLYIFDCIVLAGQKLGVFNERVKHLEDAAFIIGAILGASGDDAPRVKCKKYWPLDAGMEAGFRAAIEPREYKLDGLIITSGGDPYMETRNLKWKPMNETTIDFMAMRCPARLLGVKPFIKSPNNDIYILFVGIAHKMREKLGIGLIPCYKELFPRGADGAYYPVQFSPGNDPLAYIYYHSAAETGVADCHGKIIELGFDVAQLDGQQQMDPSSGSSRLWRFVRVRDDRIAGDGYYGNDYRIAEASFINFIDPFTFADLFAPTHGYFAKTRDDVYAAANKYKRYAFTKLLMKYGNGARWLMDLGAGRGGDIARYRQIGIGDAILIDNDKGAISKLLSRKYMFYGAGEDASADGRKISGPERVRGSDYNGIIHKTPNAGTTLHTLVADLIEPAEDLVSKISIFGAQPGCVDIAVCNFVFHYMCDTREHIANLLKFASIMLRHEGTLIITCLDGGRVFEQLAPLALNETWSIVENDRRKYAIQKKYIAPKLLPCGQVVGVLMPFSDEPKDEPLANYDVIVAEGKKCGFDATTAFLDEFLGSFARDFAKFELSNGDKEYIGLHRYIVMKKTRKVGAGFVRHIRDLNVEITHANDIHGSEILDVMTSGLNAETASLFKSQFIAMMSRSYDPAITTDDVREIWTYIPRQSLPKPSLHNGQRKLFLSELEFLTLYPEGVCVYAGAAPSNKTGYLASLFPHVKFLLIDPNPFDIYGVEPVYLARTKTLHGVQSLVDDDDKVVSYEDIVARFLRESANAPTKRSSSGLNNTCFIVNDIMTQGLSEAISIIPNILFISDIRTNMSGMNPSDLDIIWNSSQMLNWLTAMNARGNLRSFMIKWRHPFYEDEDTVRASCDKQPYATDFELSKRLGIDFVANYYARKLQFLKGRVHLQSWAPISSDESRLIGDSLEIVDHGDAALYDNVFCGWNLFQRVWGYHPGNAKYFVRGSGVDYCGDCAREIRMWELFRIATGNTTPVTELIYQLGVHSGGRYLTTEPHGHYNRRLDWDLVREIYMIGLKKSAEKNAKKAKIFKTQASAIERARVIDGATNT